LLAPEVPLSGVVANILAAPAAPVATIVGMIACLLAPVIPPLATLVAAIAWVPSAWIAGVARVSSGVPGALLPWPEGAVGALLLTGVTALGLLAVGVPARWGSAQLRRRLAAGLAATLVVIMGATAGVAALRALGRPADWVIAQCDVGQGDAVLVRSGGEVALIDTGAEPDLLRTCLSTLGVERIDLLVLTHFDLDHVGAVEVVTGRVDRAIIGPTGRGSDEAVVAALLAGGARVDTVADGEAGRLGDCAWRVLWPPAHRGVEPGNDASLVLAWAGARSAGDAATACPRLLALGDLGEQAQRMLLGAYDLGAVEVVKVSHHGSPDQHPELYRQVAASVALIGVGAENGYGHPAPDLIAELESLGSVIGRSDEHGLVLVSVNEGALRLWRERLSTVGAEN
ncbi:MAG: MBL fold metallo-hydrolase, partial [Microcella sp.]|nr:MBL fold metallo-hydrolase [Microcella sp.]